ncbi:hypothetical protein GQ42DRAFT_162445, partial [Ramicandelaber brevisporus]
IVRAASSAAAASKTAAPKPTVDEIRKRMHALKPQGEEIPERHYKDVADSFWETFVSHMQVTNPTRPPSAKALHSLITKASSPGEVQLFLILWRHHRAKFLQHEIIPSMYKDLTKLVFEKSAQLDRPDIALEVLKLRKSYGASPTPGDITLLINASGEAAERAIVKGINSLAPEATPRPLAPHVQRMMSKLDRMFMAFGFVAYYNVPYNAEMFSALIRHSVGCLEKMRELSAKMEARGPVIYRSKSKQNEPVPETDSSKPLRTFSTYGPETIDEIVRRIKTTAAEALSLSGRGMYAVDENAAKLIANVYRSTGEAQMGDAWDAVAVEIAQQKQQQHSEAKQ